MRVLINEKLSEHKYKTPEGYLICTDAILARTGKQTYRRGEVFGQDCNDSEAEIEVDRKPEEVFSDATLASFENKPLTVEHPDEDVNVNNHKDYAVGFVRDVKRGKTQDGEDVILGTLVVTDAKTIEEIENGEHTDLSCGYDCDIEDEVNPQQKHIRGNHVALCQQGRAGIARIVDSVKDNDKYEVGKVLSSISKYYSNDPGIEFVKKKLYENNFRDVTVEKVEGWKANRNIPGEYTKTYFLKIRNRKEEGYVKAICILYADDDDWKVKEIVAYTTGISNDSVHDVEPRQGESKADFISRFMEETKEEYPDVKQRLAVAYSYWENKGKKDSMKDATEKEMSDFIKKHPDVKEAVNDMLKRGIDWDVAIKWAYEDGKKKYKDSYDSVKDGDEGVDYLIELDEAGIKVYYTNGGYVEKFRSRQDYEKAKQIAAKVGYKEGKWDDKELAHYTWKSSRIGMDSFDEDLDKKIEEEILREAKSFKTKSQVLSRLKELEKKYHTQYDRNILQVLNNKGFVFDSIHDVDWDYMQFLRNYSAAQIMVAAKLANLTKRLNGKSTYADIAAALTSSEKERLKNKLMSLRDSVKDAFVVYAEGTQQNGRAMYWKKQGKPQYSDMAHADVFSSDEADRICAQRGAYRWVKRWVDRKTNDSLKKYSIYYKDADGNNCIKIVKAKSLDDAVLQSKIK